MKLAWEGESHTLEFLARNPAGAVPVLELEDGRCIAESNAILCFLAAGSPYLPDEPVERAQVMQSLFFEQDAVQPSIATLRHWTMTGKLARRHAEVVAQRRAQGEGALDVLQRHLDTTLRRCRPGSRDLAIGRSWPVRAGCRGVIGPPSQLARPSIDNPN